MPRARPLDDDGALELNGIGIWSGELRYGEESERRDAAAELEQLGYTALWIPDGGSDRLVAWGDEAAIATRVRAFFDAGADHVCVQALTSAERRDFARAEWRSLAPALVGLGPS